MAVQRHPARHGGVARPAGTEGRTDPDARFLADVLAGLGRPQKELPCKYFYDAAGSALFDAICETPEYYPTRCELEIMRAHAAEMGRRLGRGCLVIEYGSGSSVKTRWLLKHLPRPAAYVPVDISAEHLHHSAGELARRFPDIEIHPVAADFTEPFDLPLVATDVARRAVYFPGSTIGNFAPDEAIRLLKAVAEVCGPGGALLIGVDLKKDEAVLNAAYNDAAGVTAEFNLNLLTRINRELDADFDRGGFAHRAYYNAAAGRVEMHLVSRRNQTVRIGRTDVRFRAGETIHTENSHKYTPGEFGALAARAGFRPAGLWTDPAHRFSVQLYDL